MHQKCNKSFLNYIFKGEYPKKRKLIINWIQLFLNSDIIENDNVLFEKSKEGNIFFQVRA